MLEKIKAQLEKSDFEYFIKFVKTDDNFNELWRMKLLARDSLKEWLIASHVNIKHAEDIANACAELIENSIKYSKEDQEAYVSINIGDHVVVIETYNMCDPHMKDDLHTFVDDLTEERKSKDISEIYLERMNLSFTTGESKLGLIKILMETDAKIEVVETGEKDIVFFKVITSF